jgi:hypothetical protein
MHTNSDIQLFECVIFMRRLFLTQDPVKKPGSESIDITDWETIVVKNNKQGGQSGPNVVPCRDNLTDKKVTT